MTEVEGNLKLTYENNRSAEGHYQPRAQRQTPIELRIQALVQLKIYPTVTWSSFTATGLEIRLEVHK